MLIIPLFLSSFFFIIPSIYAYYNQLYFYSIVLVLISLISANYWRKTTCTWSRNLDLVFAKISFIVFSSSGIIYVRYIYYVIPSYIGLFILAYCYYLSCKLFINKNENWWKYHFLFHLIMMSELIVIIHSMY